MSVQYTTHYNKRQTPQSEPIPGREADMVENSAGGYTFPVNDWTRLDRFLILGTEGGSYYATEHKLTRENAQAVDRCIKEDGERVVERIVEISDAGRAPKNDPAIFALALCAKNGNEKTKQAAYQALSKVCRIGTHLFHFMMYAKPISGCGPGMRRALSRWYNGRPAKDVAFQAVKYQSRDGWSHANIMQLAHIKPASPDHDTVFRWMVKGKEKQLPPVADVPDPVRLIWAFEMAKTITDVEAMCRLIKNYRLPREAIPTEMLNHASVWATMLPDMGITALIRNLATMTRVGLLRPMSDACKYAIERITDEEQIKKGRVHPIQMLSALLTYRAGHGMRGKHTWEPISQVVDALDEGFYKAFGLVEPTGKRHYLALDVSGSMGGGEVAGVPGLSPRVASSAMAMLRCRVEKAWIIKGFTSGGNMRSSYGFGSSRNPIVQLPISPKQRLDDICAYTERLDFGGTDCALPMLDAAKNKIPIDIFEVYTDSETWAGDIQPVQALQQYRQKMGIPAKLVVVGMVSNGFTLADPNDAGMMDVVGFDTAAPNLISDFAKE